MDKPKINAVELVRAIRDDHCHQLMNKSEKERIDFYQKQAQNMLEKVESLLQEKNIYSLPVSSNQYNKSK